MLVSVEQAAANALARWLVTALGDDVAVDTRWPEVGVDLPPRAITVLLAGPPEEEPLDPIVVDRVNTSPTEALFTWRMSALRQPLQLDVWACFDTERDDLKESLRRALHAGMRATLGAYNAMPFRHGVVVPIADGWTGYADCYFARPSVFDSPGAAARSEFRMTYRGWADVDLTETGPSARLAALTLRRRIDGARDPDRLVTASSPDA